MPILAIVYINMSCINFCESEFHFCNCKFCESCFKNIFPFDNRSFEHLFSSDKWKGRRFYHNNSEILNNLSEYCYYNNKLVGLSIFKYVLCDMIFGLPKLRVIISVEIQLQGNQFKKLTASLITEMSVSVRFQNLSNPWLKFS